MKNWCLHKSLSTALSLLVMLSSFSITVEKHFCGGQLVDVALFTAVDKCCDDESGSNNSQDEGNGCCTNEVEVIDSINDITFESSAHFTPKMQFVLNAFFTTYRIHFEENLNIHSYRLYKPPILTPDIHVLNETYLI